MIAIWLGFSLLVATSGMAAMAQSPDFDPAGDWRGTLTAGAIKLWVAIHLGETATYDSLDQGALGLRALLKVTGNRVSMDIEGVGVFEGALSPDGSVLEGVLRQGPTAPPLRFERGSFPALKRPQTLLPPFPYQSRADQLSQSAPGECPVGRHTDLAGEWRPLSRGLADHGLRRAG